MWSPAIPNFCTPGPIPPEAGNLRSLYVRCTFGDWMEKVNWLDHILNFLGVILGVSLAFYVSNWNDYQKQSAEQLHILSSLRNELASDIGVYSTYQIEANQEHVKRIERVLARMKAGNMDSLAYYLNGCFTYTNFASPRVTFRSISSSGKIELIDDFDLRKELADFYEINVSEARHKGQTQIDFYNSHIVPWIVENMDLSSQSVQMKDKQVLINILHLYQYQIQSKIREYEKVLERSKYLKSRLDQHIQSIG